MSDRWLMTDSPETQHENRPCLCRKWARHIRYYNDVDTMDLDSAERYAAAACFTLALHTTQVAGTIAVP